MHKAFGREKNNPAGNVDGLYKASRHALGFLRNM